MNSMAEILEFAKKAKLLHSAPPPHSEAIGESEPGPVHNLIGMTALVMWPKLLYSVKLDSKLTF